MDFIKKHKILVIVLSIIIILIAIIFLFLRNFSVDLSKDEYGDRLKGIEKVQIDEKLISKIKSEISEKEEVESIDCRIQGRLIYITLKVKEETSKDSSKEIANTVLNYFDEEEKKYYDLQVLIENKKEEVEGYPFIGYKHKTSSEIVW